MRPILLAVLFAAAFCGCTESPRPEPPKVSSPISKTGTESLPPNPVEAGATYPEKADVERLLHQAREFESQGKFETALSVVNQALQFDAQSPAATTMRNHLEEIIRKI